MSQHIQMIKRKIIAYVSDESGATAIEYGLIAALIGIAVIVSGKQMGDAVNAKFACTAELLNTGANTGECSP